MPQSTQATEDLRQFSVRLPESLAKQIDAMAEGEVRSANFIVNMLVKEALAARDKKQNRKVATAA